MLTFFLVLYKKNKNINNCRDLIFLSNIYATFFKTEYDFKNILDLFSYFINISNFLNVKFFFYS